MKIKHFLVTFYMFFSLISEASTEYYRFSQVSNDSNCIMAEVDKAPIVFLQLRRTSTGKIDLINVANRTSVSDKQFYAEMKCVRYPSHDGESSTGWTPEYPCEEKSDFIIPSGYRENTTVFDDLKSKTLSLSSDSWSYFGRNSFSCAEGRVSLDSATVGLELDYSGNVANLKLKYETERSSCMVLTSGEIVRYHSKASSKECSYIGEKYDPKQERQERERKEEQKVIDNLPGPALVYVNKFGKKFYNFGDSLIPSKLAARLCSKWGLRVPTLLDYQFLREEFAADSGRIREWRGSGSGPSCYLSSEVDESSSIPEGNCSPRRPCDVALCAESDPTHHNKINAFERVFFSGTLATEVRCVL